MAFRYVALLVTIAQICASLTEAACPCTREFRPLCGSDGVTYNNPCLLRCAVSSSGKEIKIAKHVSCEDSVPEENNCVCAYDYSPVCGSDGQTYPNECGLQCQRAKFNQNLKVMYDGPCENAMDPACVCTFLYKPVCGSDGKTYNNNCLMSCAAKRNRSLKLAYNGLCTDSVKAVDV